RWCAAPDEGASKASCCCSFQATREQSQKQRFAALAPPHPPPAFAGAGSPGTFSRKREKGYPQPPSLCRRIKPFSREAEDSPSPAKPKTALLPRSGRRWCAAPDEGASEASCRRSSQATREQSQKQRFAALAPPHPPSRHLLP